MAERYQRSQIYRPPGADFSAADTATQLSQALSSFSRQSLANYEQARVAQGAQRGAEAGEGVVDASSTKKKTDATAYGRAYNQTLIEGHTAAVQANIQQNMSRLADQYKDDPDGYAQAAAGYRKGMFESVMPELQSVVGQTIDEEIRRTGGQIKQRAEARALKQAHGELAEGFDSLKRKGEQQARDGDIEGMTRTADEALGLIERNTLSPENPTGYFDPERVGQLKAGIQDDLDENLIVGQIDRAKNAKEVATIAKRLKDAKLAETDLSPQVRDRAVAHAERRIAEMEAYARSSQAEARSALQERERDDLAQYRNGIDVKEPLRLSDYVQAYGEQGPKLYADYQQNRQLGQDISMFAGMPATDITKRIASREPVPGAGYADSEARQDSLIKAANQVFAARERDPAASVKAEGATAEDLTRKRLTEQARLGIQSPQPLTNDEADEIVSRFALGTEDSAALVASISQEYGEYWPQVYAQLAERKLPSAAVAIGSGMAPGPATRLSALANVPMTEIRKGVTETPANVQSALDSQFAEFAASLDGLLGADRTAAAMYDAAERLTWSYLKQGQSTKEAAAKAYEEVIGAQYGFETVNGRVVRIPAKYNVQGVKMGLASAINKVDVGALRMPIGAASEVVADDYARAIKRRGYWVTSANQEKGVALFLDGAPVQRKDGSVYEVPWDMLLESVRLRKEQVDTALDDERQRQLERGY